MPHKAPRTKSGKSRKTFRVFQVLTTKFEAQSYYETINWQGSTDSVTYDSSPVLRNLTTSEMVVCATKEAPEKYGMLKIPCYSQAIERHVELASDASLKSCYVAERDVMIRAMKSSKAKINKFGSKKDNVCHGN